MSILSRLRNRRLARAGRPQPPMLFRVPDFAGGPGAVIPPGGEDAPTVTYEPHGIDSPQTLAEIVAKAQAEAEGSAPHEAAATAQWGEWDQPGTPLAPAAETPPPPVMPYPSGLSRVMVGQITYPDPGDLSPDKDRNYRDMLRRVGVATGTHTSLEDTGMWALPALEPGKGTGVQL